jgi:carbonic anhydrase
MRESIINVSTNHHQQKMFISVVFMFVVVFSKIGVVTGGNDNPSSTTTETPTSRNTYQSVMIDDDGRIEYLRQVIEQHRAEAFRSYETYAPTIIEDVIPTGRVRTKKPMTIIPTTEPSDVPIDTPSVSPSNPPWSDNPSAVPTVQPTASLDYYDYDTSTNARYGPGTSIYESNGTHLLVTQVINNYWGNVKPPIDGGYLKEFTKSGFGGWKGILDKYNPLSNNQCEEGLAQSPIDIVINNRSVCLETHQIRPRQGDYSLNDDTNVFKHILPTKLRVIYKRRPCSDPLVCLEPDPPNADFPQGWGGYIDMMHFDIKVPSEHTLNGYRYDGEMQLFHLHPGNKKFAVRAVWIKSSALGYNYYFQELLNQYQLLYNRNQMACKLPITIVPYQEYSPLPRREFKYNNTWNPHSLMLVDTYWFYRYNGSLTEPPCGEFVSWFIADKPMNISYEQLDQLKTIMFTNVDPITCQRTSINYNGSVARTLQPINNRPVYHCTETDFKRDLYQIGHELNPAS